MRIIGGDVFVTDVNKWPLMVLGRRSLNHSGGDLRPECGLPGLLSFVAAIRVNPTGVASWGRWTCERRTEARGSIRNSLKINR